ncbi:hypothetical protein GCM10027202_28070 [Microvirgula curvata]
MKPDMKNGKIPYSISQPCAWLGTTLSAGGAAEKWTIHHQAIVAMAASAPQRNRERWGAENRAMTDTGLKVGKCRLPVDCASLTWIKAIGKLSPWPTGAPASPVWASGRETDTFFTCFRPRGGRHAPWPDHSVTAPPGQRP